jgi:hypothetical protein
MIDRLVVLTGKIQHHLIQLGFDLPPVVDIHNNKLKQINMSFMQMSLVIANRTSPLLFTNAANVFTAIMAEHADITSLEDLLTLTERIHGYVSSY